MRSLKRCNRGTAVGTIIFFLVTLIIFCGLFGSVAWYALSASQNNSVTGEWFNITGGTYDGNATYSAKHSGIAGGPILILVVALMAIIMVVLYAVRKAGLI